MSTEDMVKSIIQVKIMEALNSPENLIEKLVKAALEKPVDQHGRFGEYNSKTPYIDYLIGSEVRNAAKEAVREMLSERMNEIKDAIKKEFISDSIVETVVQSIMKTAENDYKIDVIFKKSED